MRIVRRTYVIDGARFETLEGFYGEVSRVLELISVGEGAALGAPACAERSEAGRPDGRMLGVAPQSTLRLPAAPRRAASRRRQGACR